MSVGVISWRTDVFDAHTMTETAVRAELVCDTVADLPAPTFVAGSRLIIGSTAHVIADGGSDYMMNSAGSWILARSADLAMIIAEINQIESDLQDAAADATYAKTQIDDLIKPALVSLINQGAKNRLKLTPTSNTYTSNGITAVYDPSTGKVALSGQHITTDPAFIYNMYTGNVSDQYTIGAGTYHFSGMPSGGSTSTYRAILRNITAAVDNGSGSVFSLTGSEPIAYSILIMKSTKICIKKPAKLVWS